MFLRSALFACAAAMVVASPAVAETASPGCAETSFRVYFQPGSASLDEDVARMLDVAARNVAQCDYAELRVSVDVSSPYAAARGRAIEAAANERDWDAVRITPRAMTHRASFGGPEYAEVTMTPNAGADAPLPDRADTGV